MILAGGYFVNRFSGPPALVGRNIPFAADAGPSHANGIRFCLDQYRRKKMVFYLTILASAISLRLFRIADPYPGDLIE
jgi:hypothetical protein